ncbi:MAG: methionine adenosyltransferase domain-containing protein [Gammaproteobacteria bacterium]|nr:methionine adenosyltransferase domain-containing protein [Gammaproteobacteria bacterium]
MIEPRTAEYVRKGHPDRVCDIISDAIVDEYIKQDPDSRVAVDVFGCHGIITVGGEVASGATINIPKIVRSTYKEIGYEDEVGVQVNIIKQSPEIKVHADGGAGDSGIVVGYATSETKEMLPLEVVLAKRICSRLDSIDWLKPDGKVQVTLNGKEIKKLIVSVHGDVSKKEELRTILKNEFPHKELHLTVYEVGGFIADSGLTGRKNVLWYGPRIPTGGGAFAGKDATKVDRSGAYYARHIAIKALKKHNLKECLVELAFAIGQDKRVMTRIKGIDQNNRAIDITLADLENVGVSEMIKKLNLKESRFKETSLRGHFGHGRFNWEMC